MCRPSRLLACALLLLGALAAAGQEAPGARSGVTHRHDAGVDDDVKTDPGTYNPGQSRALFVGIRHFQKDGDLTEVRYAVDDAIDLAFALALDRNVRLVEPSHVLLALSGEPVKAESQQHLDALIAAGATQIEARHIEILDALREQARHVGRDGMLLVSIATHGFHMDGTHHLLAADSIMDFPESTIATDRLLDIAAKSTAPRALFFLDACRMHVFATMRDPGRPDVRAAAPHLAATARASGQAVFYAAAAGEFAFDDEKRKNGVFTGAVLDALHCAPGAMNDAGFVTIETLEKFVHEAVKTWVAERGNGRKSKGIQLRADGGMRGMPVAVCRGPSDDATLLSPLIIAFGHIASVLHRVQIAMTDGEPPPVERTALPPRDRPVRARIADDVVNVFGSDGTRLWRRQVGGPIVQVEVADLDGNDVNEVVVGVGGTDGDGGKICVFDARGKSLWSADTTMPTNYMGGHSGRMTIREFTTGDLFRRGKRQVVVLAIDAQGWYQSLLQVYDADGKRLGAYWHPGHLHKVVVGAATSHSEPRIVVSGVNNDLSAYLGHTGHTSTVFVFDPRNVAGEAPPQFGRSGKGSQLWYGAVFPNEQRVERLEIIDQNQDGLEEISVWMSSGTVFYLDFSGRVVETQYSQGMETVARFALVAK